MQTTLATSGKNVLLVEDDTASQKLARVFLTRSGLNVTTADNGKEALERLAAQSFDLVLMDVNMPVMGGLEATRLFRKSEQNPKRLPIIAVSANDTAAEIAECRQAGMDDHLSKPIDFAKLRDIVAKWLP
jgi:CheY-like chemotaxis protein